MRTDVATTKELARTAAATAAHRERARAEMRPREDDECQDDEGQGPVQVGLRGVVRRSERDRQWEQRLRRARGARRVCRRERRARASAPRGSVGRVRRRKSAVDGERRQTAAAT